MTLRLCMEALILLLPKWGEPVWRSWIHKPTQPPLNGWQKERLLASGQACEPPTQVDLRVVTPTMAKAIVPASTALTQPTQPGTGLGWFLQSLSHTVSCYLPWTLGGSWKSPGKCSLGPTNAKPWVLWPRDSTTRDRAQSLQSPPQPPPPLCRKGLPALGRCSGRGVANLKNQERPAALEHGNCWVYNFSFSVDQ